MPFDVSWDVNKYREDHESEEHWLLRKAFMERWKNDYSEERLVCLARVFFNIEFMGCRYPTEIMQEVARLSHDELLEPCIIQCHTQQALSWFFYDLIVSLMLRYWKRHGNMYLEVAQQYRNLRKTKLQRTFVSASDAAEDRAKGVKRSGGVIIEGPSTKSKRIDFVPQGHSDTTETINISDDEANGNQDTPNVIPVQNDKPNEMIHNETLNANNVENINEIVTYQAIDPNEYFKEMENMKCLDVRSFSERMFNSAFGRLVLLIRPWSSKLGNIQSSCQACHIPITSTYENSCFSVLVNGQLLARATGASKAEARSVVEVMAWNRLRAELVSVVIKEQFIAQGDRISVNDVSGNKRPEFGTPVDNSVATKMMKLMGWKGGGLGVDAQGIAEPIKPHLQMVNRAGLGSNTTDIRQLRRAGQELMRRYIQTDTFDLDLVFSADFSKEERALLHQCAQRAGLASRSYGSDVDRFLVVKKKLDPFSLVRAVIEKGGNTPKYQVFLPVSLRTN